MNTPILIPAPRPLVLNKSPIRRPTARAMRRRPLTPARIRRLSASPVMRRSSSRHLRRSSPHVLRHPSPVRRRRRSLPSPRRVSRVNGRPIIARPLPPERMAPRSPPEQRRPHQDDIMTTNQRIAAVRRARALQVRRASVRRMRHRDGVASQRLPPGELQTRYQRRLLRLVNAERAKYSAPPVILHETLTACARRHNADLAFLQKRLSHVGADGASLGERLHRCGYPFRYASENIARGQGSPPHVVNSWMQSPGHRKNLLNPRATHMGVHVGRGTDGRLYWAQLFGNLD